MIPIDSATSRDILTTFFMSHSMHSVNSAQLIEDRICLSCSCGLSLCFDSLMAKKVGWTLGDIASRLKKLCQLGRKDS